MRIGIPKEITPGEKRVAATPETVDKMIKAGFTVWIEKNAGHHANISDEAYRAKGATIIDSHTTLLSESDIIFKVQKPIFDASSNQNELQLLKEKAILIAPLYPFNHLSMIPQLNAKKVTAFSLDLLPRIARAQSMDILSSMSNLSGYKSVILAADYLGKIFPLMTTAAGTLLPAKVIVIGAGVAGLQAIATARRLGGIVLAFDTRPVVAEQVKSLGAEFVSLETSHEESQDAGGYAKEQSEQFYQKEQAIIQPYLKEADVVITTALIPGKRAPILITNEMIKTMKEGSVIVDLAIEQGGNCVLVEPDKIVKAHGITLIGLTNLPSTLPVHASQAYAKNIYAFLNYIAASLKENHFDLTDDIIKNCLITLDGRTIQTSLKKSLEGQTQHAT